jgi:hypothetical protein
MDYARIGGQVAQRMRELQLSNSELARRARVDRSRITMLLKGEPWSMRPDVIAKIEASLELKVGAIGALGAGRTLRSLVVEPETSSDVQTRLDELERAVEAQRELIKQLADDRLGSGRGARR